ncbi:HAMP domain-containing histidine kinase [bacterium]|nr:HAMP domain-containing histidine kinase [bacterium]
MRTKRGKYQNIYSKEFETLENAQNLLQKESLSKEELLNQFKILTESYQSLLNDAAKITKIGDYFQQKLLTVNEIIKEQKQFLEQVIESLSHPFCVLDAKTKEIKMANSSQNKLTNDFGEEFFSNLIYNNNFYFEKVISTQKHLSFEHFGTDKNQQNRYLAIYIFPLIHEGKEISELITYVLDITEQKKFEQEIKEKNEKLLEANEIIKVQYKKVQKLNKAKDEILGIVAHDLRNPISAIKWTVELIFEDYGKSLEEEQQEYIQIIDNSCNKMNILINDLLEVSKLEAENYTLPTATENVIALIKESLISFREISANKGIELVTSFPQEPVFILANREKFWQISNNLISNAIKFTNTSGKIIISVQEFENKQVLLKFSDTGIGVPEEKIPIIFDKFTKASRKGTEGETSTGLGMSITKQLVELHNGRIWLESEVGKGTTFFVQFPVSEQN